MWNHDVKHHVWKANNIAHGYDFFYDLYNGYAPNTYWIYGVDGAYHVYGVYHIYGRGHIYSASNHNLDDRSDYAYRSGFQICDDCNDCYTRHYDDPAHKPGLQQVL